MIQQVGLQGGMENAMAQYRAAMAPASPHPASPYEDAATAWHVAKARLMRAHMELEKATQEHREADQMESQAWIELERIAGRNEAKATTARAY